MQSCQSCLVVLTLEPSIAVTSSITYCAPPDVFVVQVLSILGLPIPRMTIHCPFKEFDVTYFKANQSIGFTLSATNLASNLNASANILFNAYGMTLVNVSA